MIFSAADLLAFLSASLILALTPGNDVLFIISQALNCGLKGGFAAVLGITFGLVFHLIALTLGLSELLTLYPWLFHIIRILGATYLLYLSYKAFKNSSKEPASLPEFSFSPLRKIFLRGTLTNLTNPKVALFFLAFIPQFLDPAKGKFVTQILILGVSFLLIGTFTNSLYAAFFGKTFQKVKNHRSFQKTLGRLTGFIFLGLALKLFF